METRVVVYRPLRERWQTTPGFRYDYARAVYFTHLWFREYYKPHGALCLPGVDHQVCIRNSCGQAVTNVRARATERELKLCFWDAHAVTLGGLFSDVGCFARPHQKTWWRCIFDDDIDKRTRLTTWFLLFWAHDKRLDANDQHKVLNELVRTKKRIVHRVVRRWLPPCLHPLVAAYVA